MALDHRIVVGHRIVRSSMTVSAVRNHKEDMCETKMNPSSKELASHKTLPWVTSLPDFLHQHPGPMHLQRELASAGMML